MSERKAIDWSKPVQTVDGRPVEIYNAERHHGAILIQTGGYWRIATWDEHGRFTGSLGKPSDNDLVNVPAHGEFWLNYFGYPPEPAIYIHKTHAGAVEASGFETSRGDPRLTARKRIRYTVTAGEFDMPEGE